MRKKLEVPAIIKQLAKNPLYTIKKDGDGYLLKATNRPGHEEVSHTEFNPDTSQIEKTTTTINHEIRIDIVNGRAMVGDLLLTEYIDNRQPDKTKPLSANAKEWLEKHKSRETPPAVKEAIRESKKLTPRKESVRRSLAAREADGKEWVLREPVSATKWLQNNLNDERAPKIYLWLVQHARLNYSDAKLEKRLSYLANVMQTKPTNPAAKDTEKNHIIASSHLGQISEHTSHSPDAGTVSRHSSTSPEMTNRLAEKSIEEGWFSKK